MAIATKPQIVQTMQQHIDEHKQRGAPADLDAGALAKELKAKIDGEVRFDEGSRALYATDASNYRQVPIGVVIPEDHRRCCADGDAVPAAWRAGPGAGRRHQPGRAVLQCRRRDRLLQISEPVSSSLIPSSKHARVQPGMVLDSLRDAAERTTSPSAPTRPRTATAPWAA